MEISNEQNESMTNTNNHIHLGKFNSLTVIKKVDFGLYLDAGEDGEILLPTRYIPEGCEIGDNLDVFIYLDNEERLIATTLTPYIEVGKFSYLKVSWVNRFGAFLDWGLMKDLFVPFSEQKKKMEIGKSYIVYCYVDEESYRIVATAKIDHLLSNYILEYSNNQAVDILIWQKTDLGFKAIIENKFAGLLYDNEIFENIHTGDKLTAYVKKIRDDGKIDLSLQQIGINNVKDFSSTLLQYIKDNNGMITINDKSPAEVIYNTFGVSKKTYKKAIGELYKKHLISLDEDEIRLV